MGIDITQGLSGLSPFIQDIGIEIIEMEKGVSQVGLNLAARHMNGWETVHGGVVMTMLDVAMSLAGRSLFPETRGGVTLDMNTSFLQPAGVAGERIIARGKAYHPSVTVCFCEAELWNGEKLMAKAMGTFKYFKRSETKKSIKDE